MNVRSIGMDTMTGERPAGFVGPLFSKRGYRWVSKVSLVAAGVLTVFNGIAHLALPVVYPWHQHVAGVYPPIQWALFATTVFFGALLVLAGILTIQVGSSVTEPTRVETTLVAGMGVFWLFSALYGVVVPFPAPIVEWIIPIFAFLVAGLHFGGLWLVRRRTNNRTHSVTDN